MPRRNIAGPLGDNKPWSNFMLKSYLCLFCICVISACLSAARAAQNDWAEGTSHKADGATRDYYNRAGLLPWKNFLGDWRDANDEPQGNRPYAVALIVDDDSGKLVEWDVTELVRQWQAGKYQNQGMFLRPVGGRGKYDFRSREHPEPDKRPRLVITGEKGSVSLSPEADTFLTRSTYRSLGDQDSLRVSDSPDHVLLRFNLDGTQRVGDVKKATLGLYSFAQYGSSMEIGIFRCAQGQDLRTSKPTLGLAAKYPGDRGIRGDPDVVFFTDFESDEWADEWTQAADLKVLTTVESDQQRKFEPLQGKALRVKIAEGSTGAMSTSYKFRQETGAEPEEIYFRYYLRLADDWNQTLQGGKLPGISGTYGIAGWGGRKSDGTNGWSARGSFSLTIPADNPLGGTTPIGTYCYHADMQGQYGDIWVWQNEYLGFLENNRWYSIEQYLKLNTPGVKDGVLRAWVDGRPAFEKTDICFRHVDKLKIEQVWMNVYHGGKKPSPYDQHLYIDNVVIAKQYIGPMVPARPGHRD
jgi:hypothetical protein